MFGKEEHKESCRKYREKMKNRKIISIPKEKKCPRCEQIKKSSDFNKCKKELDGLQTYCRDCQKEIHKQYIERKKLQKITEFPKEKKCSTCGLIKQTEDFSKSFRSSDGLSHICKECDNERHLFKKFRITKKEYERLLKKQNNKCLICKQEETLLDKYGNKRRLVVDHDHKTDKFRGLLCSKCNSALGFFQDNYNILMRATLYKQHNGSLSWLD